MFSVAAGLTLGMSGGSSDGDDEASALPTVAPNVSNNTQAQASPSPRPSPTSTAALTRQDCTTIRGTEYRNDDERDYFQKNCLTTAQAATTPTTTASSASATPASSGTPSSNATTSNATSGNSAPSGGTQSAASASNTSAAPVQQQQATGHVVGVEYGLGDQLVIPSIGLNATVTGMDVGSDGMMKDPAGYFNAVWYNFAAIPGLGGYVDGGNLVMAGHVDCGRCYNGGAGAAVFWDVRYLPVGASIQYYSGGQVYNYVVSASGDYGPGADWEGIVAAGSADMTIITCDGTFDPSAREYSHRRVIFARKT